MERMLRGQASTEYLLLLAIVVVVGLLAVASVVDVPGLLAGAGAPQHRAFWRDADIAVLGATLHEDGSGVLLVKNQKGFAIMLDDVKLNGKDVSLNARLYPGEEKTLSFGAGAGPTGSGAFALIVDFGYSDAESSGGRELRYAPGVPLEGDYEK